MLSITFHDYIVIQLHLQNKLKIFLCFFFSPIHHSLFGSFSQKKTFSSSAINARRITSFAPSTAPFFFDLPMYVSFDLFKMFFSCLIFHSIDLRLRKNYADADL